MKSTSAITVLENAGKHLVKTRNISRAKLLKFNAIGASHTESGPDLQALALIAVLIARSVDAKTDGWDTTVCRNLGLAA